MNTAIGIGDNTYAVGAGETGARGREPAEPSGEDSQQRFADVLPLAQATLERPSDTSPPEETPPPDGRTEAEVAAEPSTHKGHPEQRASTQDRDVSADPQVAVWPFARVIQSAALRPARAGSAHAKPAKSTTGQEAPEPVVSGFGAQVAEQASKPGLLTQGAVDRVPPSGQGTQKPKTQQTPSVPPGQSVPAGEQPLASTCAVAGIVTKTTAAKPQETTLREVAVRGTLPTAPKTPPAVTAGPVPQAAQTATPAVQAGQADGKQGREGRPSVVHTMREASQVSDPETPVPDKSSPGRQKAPVADPSEHTPAKNQMTTPPQATGPENPLKSGKAPPEQPLPTEERQDKSTKPSAAIRGEGPKGEATPARGKEVASAVAKEAEAAVPEQRVSPTGDTAASSHRPAAQIQSQTETGAPPARSPVPSVGEQMLDSIHAATMRGDRQVLIRLNPPELGTVLVRFQEQGDQLSGTLEVSNRETRREIENALPHVVRSLHEAGVQIRRVEVVTQDQPERGPGGDHQPRDVWQQHPGAGQGREHSHGAPQARWSQSPGGHSTLGQGPADDEPRAAAGPGRIDVLL